MRHWPSDWVSIGDWWRRVSGTAAQWRKDKKLKRYAAEASCGVAATQSVSLRLSSVSSEKSIQLKVDRRQYVVLLF